MIWLVTRLVVVPVKAALGGMKLGFWTGRLVGYRRIAVLATGTVIGLLVAPVPGEQLRARLKAKLDGGRTVPVAAPARPPTPTVVVPTPATGPSPDAPRVTLTPVATPPSAAAAAAGGEDEGGEDEALPAVPDADPAVIDPGTS